MKQIFSENTIIENLLVCYFMQDVYPVLANDVVSAIGEFLNFYKMSDVLNEANHADAIKKIYSAITCENRVEFLKSINMSETMLFRFRNKIVEELSKHIRNAKSLISD